MNNSNTAPRVDLQALAGPVQYAKTVTMEGFDSTVDTELRGKHLRFVASSRRLLWQALGHEYIEPELLDFIDNIPDGGVLFDIGASTGIFAMYAASHGCAVVAFEPEAANFAILSQNAFLNRMHATCQPQCFNLALSDTTGLGKIFIKKYEAGGHLKILDQPKAVGAGTFEPEYIQPVLTFRLDDFLLQTQTPAPQYLKIDVDGTELKVLRGMPGLLQNSRLRAVFIELEEGKSDTADCLDLLDAAGFSLIAKKQVQNYLGLHNLIFERLDPGAQRTA